MFYRMSDELSKPGSFAAREAAIADFDSDVAQWKLQYDAFPDFTPEFTAVWLTEDSSLVDFVHDGNAIGGQGLLISEKVLKILQKMKLPPHRHYPLEVSHKGKTISKPYFWLQILTMDNYGWIDFSKSAFTLKDQFDMEDGPGDPVTIKSATELKKTIGDMEDKYILFTKLTLNDQYAKAPYDLFYFDRLGGLAASDPIINEKLKSALKNEKVVGYKLKKIPGMTM